MIKYAIIIDEEKGLCNVALGADIDYYITNGYTELDVLQSDIDNNWYLADKCPMKTNEEKVEEEAKRIAMLSLTRGDVFRGLLQAKGVTRSQLRAMIETNENLTEIEREMALIDFDEALNFYRGNALINTVGLELGITSDQLDKFFEANDYKSLI